MTTQIPIWFCVLICICLGLGVVLEQCECIIRQHGLITLSVSLQLRLFHRLT